eukprot:TRINITY_DN5333_c0_g1_i1.p1 TRINITY_DN5333_c0_g1~~TRINITY_DN5333_c0_g1_i1.p1  ORF type:complete len:313 (+),score=54.24 TRINITY_DN5333_c0_g1_i1:23-940(+)
MATEDRLAKIEATLQQIVQSLQAIRSGHASEARLQQLVDQQLRANLQPLTNALQTTITTHKTEREFISHQLHEIQANLEHSPVAAELRTELEAQVSNLRQLIANQHGELKDAIGTGVTAQIERCVGSVLESSQRQHQQLRDTLQVAWSSAAPVTSRVPRPPLQSTIPFSPASHERSVHFDLNTVLEKETPQATVQNTPQKASANSLPTAQRNVLPSSTLPVSPGADGATKELFAINENVPLLVDLISSESYPTERSVLACFDGIASLRAPTGILDLGGPEAAIFGGLSAEEVLSQWTGEQKPASF